jgi:Transaldolase/Fructose-6-phosphate aldolase
LRFLVHVVVDPVVTVKPRCGLSLAQRAERRPDLGREPRLHALGQSLWLDSINRVMLRTGALARSVRDLAVTGLTSNPTILGHAMAAGSDYDRSLARLAVKVSLVLRTWCTPWRWRT